MNGFLCLMMLLAGFPRGENADYKMIVDHILYDDNYDYIDSEDIWFGLFETDSGYELRLVELQLTPNPPPLEDWERPTGASVDILNETERALILLTSTKVSFVDGAVPTAFHGYRQLNPDTSIILEAAGVQETLLFTTEEGLFLSGSEISQCITDTYPGSGSSSIFVGLVWAGDLDRDGIIDLIIDDVNNSYHYYDYNLYLSSEAGPDSIVRLVASFFDVYY